MGNGLVCENCGDPLVFKYFFAVMMGLNRQPFVLPGKMNENVIRHDRHGRQYHEKIDRKPTITIALLLQRPASANCLLAAAAIEASPRWFSTGGGLGSDIGSGPRRIGAGLEAPDRTRWWFASSRQEWTGC